MYITTNALVLRCADYKESSRMLTLLTESDGKLSVSAKGAKRKNSRLAAASQPYVYSEVTLSHSAGRWYLTEGSVLEFFPGISSDIERLALAAYFSELMETVCREEISESEILRLGLNTFYTLGDGKKSLSLIKAAFELRLMCASGYAPALDCCAICGNPSPDEPVLDVDGGELMCRACSSERNITAARLNSGALSAARYIESTDDRRLFSFSLDEESLRRLSRASELYVIHQLEHGFRTLDYYKQFGAEK